MALLVIGLGSNIEPKVENLFKAQEALAALFGPSLKVSAIYSSSSWGVEGKDDYLNQVICFQTHSSPKECLHILKETEKSLGRKTRERWAEREIDMDILFYDDLIMDQKGLTIPHISLHLRNFVLVPLAEILPDFIHPRLNKSISTLLAESKDPIKVIPWSI